MITLKRAIEVLQTDLLTPGSYQLKTGAGDKLDFQDAEQLGIEAMKRCKYIAEHTDRWSGVLLPGETPEEET